MVEPPNWKILVKRVNINKSLSCHHPVIESTCIRTQGFPSPRAFKQKKTGRFFAWGEHQQFCWLVGWSRVTKTNLGVQASSNIQNWKNRAMLHWTGLCFPLQSLTLLVARFLYAISTRHMVHPKSCFHFSGVKIAREWVHIPPNRKAGKSSTQKCLAMINIRSESLLHAHLHEP